MSTIVATETEIQSALPAKKESTEWLELPVFLSSFGRLRDEALIDVLKTCVRTRKLENVDVKSISHETWNAKNDLSKDIYNIRKINNLAALYLKEGQHELAVNVLLRGWKRAGEIECNKTRFAFLMKICELSYGLHKYQQALAIFRDIQEPTDARYLKSYIILGAKAWCAIGDPQSALQFFQRAIRGEPLRMAIRVLAVLSVDLKKVGVFEAARSTIENMAGGANHSEIWTVTEFVSPSANQPADKTILQKRAFRGLFALGCASLLIFLYWIECRSLAAVEWANP